MSTASPEGQVSFYDLMSAIVPGVRQMPEIYTRELFSVLERLAPTIAHTPLVAGSFIMNHQALPIGIDFGTLHTVLLLEKLSSEIKQLQGRR